MQYDLELDKTIKEIKKQKAKLVCIQLPDGLKPEACKIQKEIKSKTDAEVLIWLGSCYGACDTPKLDNVDLLIQWGHSEWQF
ncbi:diphthamide synthesis protein [Candidatus Woesearchaeota archaeon]|nr:diphthamide synthesis protein [Candidatus Woesearchaeota archaeon]